MVEMSPLTRKCLILAGPLITFPLLFFGPEFRCLFVIVVLSTYWIGEVMPIGITSLLPLALFPILQIVSSKQLAPVYFKDSIVLFMVTLIMAMGVQSTGLHRRIALKLLTKVGAKQPIMLLGFMAITSFISFFVSDTACTALMCPTAIALLSTITDAAKLEKRNNPNHVEENKPSKTAKKDDDLSVADKLGIDNMSSEDRGFCKALILCCAHASLIGGTTIITSTGPNLVFRENIQNRYPEGQITMTYLEWMVFAFPPMILYLLASYLILVCYFMGPKTLIRWFTPPNPEEAQMNRAIEKNIQIMYDDLGPIGFGETSVGVFFIVLIGSWISRDPGFTSGWADLLEKRNYLTDSAVGILIATILFLWPKSLDDPSIPILEWSDMKSKYSWSCTLLIGAGYAISEGVFKSGLANLISCGMRKLFLNMTPLPLQICVTITIVIMTEFASNVSTGSIFIPISLGVAESMGVHPLYLSLPTTVACSFAFMLPISTPPNAIVYDTRVITMIDMIACGFLLNIACILITTLNMNTWTYLVFGLSNFPENLSLINSTLLC